MNPNELRVRFRNLVNAKPRPWYRVANQAAGPTQIHIYNDIGMGGICAEDLVDDLNAINGPVELRLNSGGGEIFEGIAIYNALCARDVAVYIDGLAGSAASFIAMAASPGKLLMAKTATMMIHDGQAIAMGNARELTSMVDVLNRESEKIAAIYADRSGKPADYFRAKMQAETWYNAEEALAEGLIDVIFDPRTGQDVAQTQTQARQPVHAAAGAGTLTNATGAAGASQGAKDLGDGWVQDADGSTRFDPDGDGDDDSTPEGDTDNDYFDADGKQIKAIPPCPSGSKATAATSVELLNAAAQNHGPFTGTHTHAHPAFAGTDANNDGVHGHEHVHDSDNAHNHTHAEVGTVTGQAGAAVTNASVDGAAWDASKAWHNGAEADDPAAFYEGICAGKRSGDPSTQAGWALPYKYHPSDSPNAAGVRAALARLSSTEGLINKSEAHDKLQGLMKSINPDYKPGDQMDGSLLSAVLTSGLRGAN